MAKEDLKKYRDALEHTRREFSKKDLSRVIELSGAKPYGQSGLIIPYIGELCLVTYPEGEVCIYKADEGLDKNEIKKDNNNHFENNRRLEITDKILILQYLCEVCGVQPNGKWISLRELPSGSNHYASFKTDAMEPLAKRFGSSLELFRKVCRKLGGQELSMGDAGYSIQGFPKLELAFIIWQADDEFPTQANILFDATASLHLNTEALGVLGNSMAERIINMANSDLS